MRHIVVVGDEALAVRTDGDDRADRPGIGAPWREGRVDPLSLELARARIVERPIAQPADERGAPAQPRHRHERRRHVAAMVGDAARHLAFPGAQRPVDVDDIVDR